MPALNVKGPYQVQVYWIITNQGGGAYQFRLTYMDKDGQVITAGGLGINTAIYDPPVGTQFSMFSDLLRNPRALAASILGGNKAQAFGVAIVDEGDGNRSIVQEYNLTPNQVVEVQIVAPAVHPTPPPDGGHGGTPEHVEEGSPLLWIGAGVAALGLLAVVQKR